MEKPLAGWAGWWQGAWGPNSWHPLSQDVHMASYTRSFYLLGQLVNTVWVKKGDQILFSSTFEANVTTHDIAVSACPSPR